MKLLDDKGRLFGLINLIDLLVLILVVAVLAGGAYKLTRPPKSGDAGAGDKVTVLALVSNVSQYTVDAVTVGSNVFDPTSKGHMGKVTKVEVVPHREPVETADGRVVMAEVPERFDIFLTFEAVATVTDYSVRSASYDLRVGATVTLGSRDFMVSTTVLRVDIAD
ncbi:MAG TPA: DUF4330 domain-containing protein [Firmicutes bacterium]|nr:DUF4330 domain-containing protein [Bacillota bacterium]